MIRVKFRNFHILHAVCWIRKYFVKSADSKNFWLANDLTIFLLEYIHMHVNSSLYKCHDFAFLSIEITIRLENELSAFFQNEFQSFRKNRFTTRLQLWFKSTCKSHNDLGKNFVSFLSLCDVFFTEFSFHFSPHLFVDQNTQKIGQSKLRNWHFYNFFKFPSIL